MEDFTIRMQLSDFVSAAAAAAAALKK